MQKKLETEQWKIERLVRTEGTFIANQASLRGYEEAGIKQYMFLARVDKRTSEICKEMNYYIYNVSEAVAGKNLPPMHPWCRSTTIPFFTDYSKVITTYKNDFYENGQLEIKEVALHAMATAVKRSVSIDDIKYTLNNPKKISDVKIEKNGEKSYTLESDKSAISINPDTGKIITVWSKYKT